MKLLKNVTFEMKSRVSPTYQSILVDEFPTGPHPSSKVLRRRNHEGVDIWKKTGGVGTNLTQHKGTWGCPSDNSEKAKVSGSPAVMLLADCWAYCHLIIKNTALACVAQWVECQPVNQRVTSLIPSQGTCLGCRTGLQ